MKKIFEEYKETTKELLKNKYFVIITLLVTILGFGFTITNSSIGMDDTCFDRYYIGKEMLGIGRWGAYIIYMTLGIIEFSPFWADFVATFVIYSTAILWCVFFKKNIKDISNKTIIAFASVYLSFPIINEMFIFQNCNIAVMLGYFLIPFALMIFYENYFNIHKKWIYVLVSFILIFGISTYEACIQTGLITICIIGFILLGNKEKNQKEILKFLLYSVLILGISAIINVVITKIIYMLGITPSDVADKEMQWGKYGVIDSILCILYNIKEALKNTRYMPIIIFDVVAVLGAIRIIIKSYKENIVLGLLLFIVMFLSNFAISIITLDSVKYRTCVSWGLFVAFVIMILYKDMLKYKFTKIIGIIVLVILVLQQSRYLNQLFYNDYIRYQRDLNIAFDLINELEENYNVNKPLVIMGTPKKGIGKYGAQSNSLSVLWWGQKAFGNGDEFIKFLNSLGYKFKTPNDEQYNKGKEKAKTMNKYPKDGSILELEDCIIINF